MAWLSMESVEIRDASFSETQQASALNATRRRSFQCSSIGRLLIFEKAPTLITTHHIT